MKNHTNLTQQFFQRYPGPFDYISSTDGVDNIFAVDCTATGSYIVAVHFWDAWEESELTANAVAFALNMLSSGEQYAWTADRLPACVNRLLAEHPGPFYTRKIDGDDPANLVVCAATGAYVIKESRRPCNGFETEMVTATVAEALNSLRQPGLLDRPRRILAAMTAAD